MPTDILNEARNIVAAYADPLSLSETAIERSHRSVSLSVHGILYNHRHNPDGSMTFTMRGLGRTSPVDSSRPIIPHRFVASAEIATAILLNIGMLIWIEGRLTTDGTSLIVVDIDFDPLPSVRRQTP